MNSTELAALDWFSAHLSFQGSIYGSHADRIILNVAAPFIHTCRENDWTHRYFFIRYDDGTPHIRLRVLGALDQHEDELVAALHDRVSDAFPVELRPASVDSPVSFVPYTREVHRYGGQQGIQLAEAFFQVSTDLCLTLLENGAATSEASRRGQGLLSMTVLLHAFAESRLQARNVAQAYSEICLDRIADNTGRQELVRAFETGYNRQNEMLEAAVAQTWAQLDAEDHLPTALGNFHDALQPIRSQLNELATHRRLSKNDASLDSYAQTVGALLPSYMHMTSNRLGLAIRQEAYLAYLIAQSLDPDT